MSNCEVEFQKIHDTFQPKIYRYLSRLIGEHEAEDLTQEVFAKISRGIKNFRGDSKLSTWIYKIATNTALDRLRSPSFQRIGRKEISEEEVESDIEHKAPSVDQELTREEMNTCIRNFTENLPANYRAVVVLSEIEGLKNEEISKILGITIDTVKIRLHRARAKLKKELETNCSFYRDERNEFACDLKSINSKVKVQNNKSKSKIKIP